MVRQAARYSRREELLQAAARLFAERGFHGVGVDDIGAAVGITGPGLYRHFPSKDAMLAEMLVHISEELLAGGATRVGAQPDPHQALEDLICWHVDFALSNPALITVHDRDLGNLPEAEQRRVRRLQRRYVEEWVGVIRQATPHTGEAEARAAAHALFGLLNSTPHSASGLDRAAMTGLLTGLARRALGLPSPESG